jgi:hypothetical protein
LAAMFSSPVDLFFLWFGVSDDIFEGVV